MFLYSCQEMADSSLLGSRRPRDRAATCRAVAKRLVQSVKNPPFLPGGYIPLLLGCAGVCALPSGRYGYLASRLGCCFLLGYYRGSFWLSFCLGFRRRRYGGRRCYLLLLASGTTNNLLCREYPKGILCQIFQHPISVRRLTPWDQSSSFSLVGCIARVYSTLPVRIAELDQLNNLGSSEYCSDVIASRCFDSAAIRHWNLQYGLEDRSRLNLIRL
jgi:hypothetical protein